MPQNVLLYVVDDFANVAYSFQQSLREVGVIANGLKHVTHGINYPKHIRKIVHDAELMGAVNSASHILYMQSTGPSMDAIPINRGRKKLFLFVGDQNYRVNPNKVLSYYKYLDMVLYQGSDLKGKSPLPEAWMLPAVDTKLLQTKQDVSFMPQSSPIRIAHYPRKAADKGSSVINKVMQRLSQDPTVSSKFIYVYSEEWRRDWEESMERLDQCDVYIEQQAYTIKHRGEERPLEEFGVTALEAAALSKVVVTCFKSFKDYEKEFKARSEIIPSGSEEELEKRLRELLSLSIDAVVEKRINTRKWVHDCHGYKATGLRLARLLGLKIKG